MQLFYNPNITESNTNFSFDKDESRHIIKVLRKKEGQLLHITNGQGDLFKAEITIANPNHCEVKINEFYHKPKRNFHLHLAVAPTKVNDRYEWFLEKATEIGVEEITPIISDNSERKLVKIERFEKILQSAMKQSLHYYLPKLNPPIKLKSFIEQAPDGQNFIAHCDSTKKTHLKSVLKPHTDCIILIGPEGDFSIKEIDLALQFNFTPVTLGENRLRTETAGIVACHSVAFINENS